MRDDVLHTAVSTFLAKYNGGNGLEAMKACVGALESAGFKIVGREATQGVIGAILDGTPDSFHFTAAQPLWAAAFDAAPLYGEVGE